MQEPIQLGWGTLLRATARVYSDNSRIRNNGSWTLTVHVALPGVRKIRKERNTCTGTKKEALQQLGVLVGVCQPVPKKVRKRRTNTLVPAAAGAPRARRACVPLCETPEPTTTKPANKQKQSAKRSNRPQEVLPPIQPKNFLEVNAAFSRLQAQVRSVAAEKDAECRSLLKEKDRVIGCLQYEKRKLQKTVAQLCPTDPMPPGTVADRGLTGSGSVSGAGRPVTLAAATKDVMEGASLEPYGSRATFYDHLQRFINSTVSDAAKGNVTRAKSLAIGLANHLDVGRTTTASEDGALGAGLLKMLGLVLSGDDKGATNESGKSKGRCSNFQRVIGDCIDDVCALALEDAPSLNAAKLGKRLGRNPRLIRLATHRLKTARQTMQMRESLIRFRGKVRSDILNPAWERFAKNFWITGTNPDGEEISRKSEISKKTMRNPHDLSDEFSYRHRYLVVTVGQEHAFMLEAAAKEALTDDRFVGFHLSATRNTELRPFWVKDACRETCLCIYHLCFMDATKALYTYMRLKRSKCTNGCKCTFPLFQDSPDMWHFLLCEKPEGDRVYPRACVNNTCETCAGAKRLDAYLCGCCKLDDNIKWSRYVDVPTGRTRETDDGKEENVTHKQFVDQGPNGLGTPLSDFLEYFKEHLYPEFVKHHDLAVWQVATQVCSCWVESATLVFAGLRLANAEAKLPLAPLCHCRGFSRKLHPRRQLGATECILVPHPVRYAHCPSHCGWADAWLGAGMYVMVCMFHIDDLTNIPDDEKARLKQMLTEQGLPHTITESHIGKHNWLSHCLIACALQASAQTRHMGLPWCSTSMSFSTCTCNNTHPG